jgi:protein-disulfide isomerase
VDQVLQAFPKDVRFVYKQFPLEQIHPNALNAAKAHVAAGNQGKYWEMHDELFKISRNLSMDEIRKKAEMIGLDLKKFDKDMADPETEKTVRADLEAGRTSGVSGTPTMFLNGRRVMNRSLDGIKAMVEEELKKKKS